MKPFYLHCLLGLVLQVHAVRAQSDSDCLNITHPGAICCDDSLCAGDPMPLLVQSAAPIGGAGALEFVWDVMPIIPGEEPYWQPIPDATGANYQVNNLEAGRYFFIRAVRRAGCAAYFSGNWVEIIVLPENSLECPAVKTSTPGSAESRPYHLNSNNAAISNTTHTELQVLVWDLAGRLLLRFEVAGKSETVVPLSGLPKGILMVQVQDLLGNTWLEKMPNF